MFLHAHIFIVAGIAVITLIDGVKTVDDIADVLTEKYDATIETIKTDVSEFLNDLSEKKVILME